MSKIITRTLIAVFLAALLAAVAAAQQTTTPQPAPKEPEYVQEKGFKSRVFEIKHRDPLRLVTVLKPLGSGFKGATMQPHGEFMTITVRDFPENIAAVEEAIKRLDTPEAPSPDIEFKIHILVAGGVASGGDFPADLNDVVKPLQATLSYKNYGLMTSAIHRAKEGPQGIENNGVAESKLFNINNPSGNPIFYRYNLLGIVIEGDAAGGSVVRVENVWFSMRIPISIGDKVQYENVGFKSPVRLRTGEKVVVGTTTMGDKGLIVVLSARVLK